MPVFRNEFMDKKTDSHINGLICPNIFLVYFCHRRLIKSNYGSLVTIDFVLQFGTIQIEKKHRRKSPLSTYAFSDFHSYTRSMHSKNDIQNHSFRYTLRIKIAFPDRSAPSTSHYMHHNHNRNNKTSQSARA